MRRVLSVSALLLGIAMIWLWSGTGRASLESLDRGPDDATAQPEVEIARDADVQRQSVNEAGARPTAQRSFDDYFEELVTLGIDLWKAVEGSRTDPGQQLLVETIDAEMRELYDEMIARIPGADETALLLRSSLEASDAGIREQIRRELLNRLIRDGLQERWQRGRSLGNHAPSDRLLAAILPTLSQDQLIATDLGTASLKGRPYLGAAQEAEVMHLIELSASEPFLVEVASSLLLTLWDNMTERGERMAERLASLAFLFKDDENPARRLAALEYLLTNEAGQYRRLVIDLVLASHDAELARLLAHSAATALEPQLALEVMNSMISLAGSSLMTPLMVLGSKDSELLGQAYEQRLADGVDAQMRAELITGVGFAGTANSVELAKTALQYDPDPEVVSRALFVLSASGDIELAEQSLLRALDDPRIGGDPVRLGGIVHALHNLTGGGAINALHRLGQRLAAMPNLLPGDRLELEKILARSLPQGRK